MKKIVLVLSLGLIAQTLQAQFLVLPNSGFENWTGVEPDNWFTNNAHGLCEPVTKSTDAHSGNFAVRGEVLHCDAVDYAPNLGTPSGSLFAVAQLYYSFNFFFKYHKVNNDVTIISVLLSTASGYPTGYGDAKITSSATTYTPISIPIHYLPGDSIPAEMAIVIGIQDTVTFTSSPGSYFIFDDFSLGGFIGIDELYSEENVHIFDNPSDDFISFSLPEKNPSNAISLSDVTGKQFVAPFHSENSFNRIPTADLANGIYFLSIMSEKNVRIKKVIISR